LTVTITAIQPRLRLSGTNRLGFQPSMAISGGSASINTTSFPVSQKWPGQWLSGYSINTMQKSEVKSLRRPHCR
ncbi:MAG: hypothetical protein KZQ65_11060, partial [Candidatus Thiodiazotropha sp. (ex Gloverina cf. vestifex)]|nr:hypothetical protein [Candidatus Thiodiazotropha sp. (ex Gloverina cf. vestifex)]